MKYRVLSLAVLSVIIYSCASKSNAPTTSGKEAKPVETKATATAMSPELVEGKELYENNCGKCHKLYTPSSFSAQEWKPIVERMQKKAHLDEMKGQKIYSYLTMK